MYKYISNTTITCARCRGHCPHALPMPVVAVDQEKFPWQSTSSHATINSWIHVNVGNGIEMFTVYAVGIRADACQCEQRTSHEDLTITKEPKRYAAQLHTKENCWPLYWTRRLWLETRGCNVASARSWAHACSYRTIACQQVQYFLMRMPSATCK